GAEQIAVRARDCGFEVVYEGIRLTPAQIVNAALEEGVHVVGLSILSGSHVALARAVLAGMKKAGIGEVPLVLGGIVPPEDEKALKDAGVARVFTPKDYDLTRVMDEIVTIAEGAFKPSPATAGEGGRRKAAAG
ncbi:MAG: cobalamin-dependent protein, partial [Alphaproteobacteria bacterium]|nr:cobalamin-dependent protein [Alphaproteobacteria bacterium]